MSSIIPISKGLNKSTSTVKKNYRVIALSSLLSKIFDNCIISLQESCLPTDDLQFAYKSKTSTVQCILYNTYCTFIWTCPRHSRV